MITNCDAKELEIMALIDREFLNGIPTDQKYNKAIEEILYNEYGCGFLETEDEKRFEIPDYIDESDILIWEAEKTLYFASIINAYPEAKEYILKK